MTSPGGSTEKRFLSSALSAYGSQFGRVLIRTAAELALARLIVPEGWGVFSLARAVTIVAALLRDSGTTYHLVRDRREPWGEVLAWVLSTGALISALLMLWPQPLAFFDPSLPEVMRWFGLWVFLDGVAVVPKVFFERRLAVRQLVAPEILRGALYATVAITLAALGHGVWSLVIGELAAAAFYAAAVWFRARGRIPLGCDPGRLPGLLRKSALLLLIALAAVPIPYVQRFFVAAYDSAGSEAVGFFDKAYEWGLRLQILILPAFLRVVYPALVEYRGDRRRLVDAYRLGTVTILALETLAAYFLFFNAEVVLVNILLGDQWPEAVPLLKILCFLPLVDPFTRLGGEVLKVREEDRLWLLIVLVNMASLLTFGFLLAAPFGAPGMAWANYLLLGNLVMAWRMAKICGPDFWHLLRELLFVYLVPLPAFALVAWAFPDGSWSRFAASVVAGALAAAVLILRFRAPVMGFFFAPAGHADKEASS
ncbi:MAG: oligosaccharide flippase family protein [Acidobacteriota bacterium]